MDQYGQNSERRNAQRFGGEGIRISAIPGALARRMVWAVPLFLVLVILSFIFTRGIKREYVSDGRILVQLGPEYVYNPASGSTNFNSPLSVTSDQVVSTEIGIIKNSAIVEQVIHKMIASPANGGVGGERFAPKLYERWLKSDDVDKADRWNDIIKLVDRAYSVTPKPKSSIVDLAYKHTDGPVAVKTLDALMSSYANFRKEKFVISQTGQIGERRADTEEQLAAIEIKIQSVLDRNGISDFTSEQTGVQKRAEDLRTQLNMLTGNLAAAEGALAASEDQLRSLPPTMDLYVEDRASQRLAQAELEKRQLLAKYLPTSNPVRAKNAEINEIRAQINSNGGKATGGRRVGPNPVYQALQTQRNTYQATADSLREQQIILQRQTNSAVAKVKTLRKLAPQYANLLREKVAVEARLEGLQAREAETLVAEKQVEDSSENIKIITRPSVSRKGRNMKKIVFALGILGSAFSVGMLALLSVFLDPKIYGSGVLGRRTANMGPVNMSPVPVQNYYEEIPESVPYQSPYQEQTPAYGAAPHGADHASAAHGDGSYDAYGNFVGGAFEGDGYLGGGYDTGGGQSGGYDDAGQHGGYEDGGAYDQTAYNSPYGEPAPVEYVVPPEAQESPATYADGSVPETGSYGAQEVQTYPEQSPVQHNPVQSSVQSSVQASGYSSMPSPTDGNASQPYGAGPDGNIPVLGGVNPYRS